MSFLLMKILISNFKIINHTLNLWGEQYSPNLSFEFWCFNEFYKTILYSIPTIFYSQSTFFSISEQPERRSRAQ